MNSTQIDLFVEDRTHEEFIARLLERLARQQQRRINCKVCSARGGHSKVLEELSLYQTAVLKGVSGLVLPELLVVAIDANCQSFKSARRAISEKLEPEFRDRTIIACPDPHIERWYLADLTSFTKVVGTRPQIGQKQCERDLYKATLADAIIKAGHPPTLSGIEFARELVEEMDLYRAGEHVRSLKHFLDEVRARLKSA